MDNSLNRGSLAGGNGDYGFYMFALILLFVVCILPGVTVMEWSSKSPEEQQRIKERIERERAQHHESDDYHPSFHYTGSQFIFF